MLIGNLTKDPELRSTTTGISVCSFSIGVSRRFQNQEGERETDFFNIVVWRKQGETAAKYLRKGSQVAIAGQIQIRNYEAKDGTKRYVTEIHAEEVQFLSKSGESDTGASQGATEGDIIEVSELPDDLPF
jgi:single-strand DNA-binding protein